VFGESQGGFIGNPIHYALFLNVPLDDCLPEQPSANTIPALLFAAFQLSFFIMMPVIISGSWAEKMKFEAFLIFLVLFSILVYCPVAHWVWNLGGFLAKLGLEDFSGGLVIHTATGVSGLVTACFLYKRRQVGRIEPHSVIFFVLGSSLIWIGWYSFNAGSAYKANDQAVRALINTHFSASSSACVFIILNYIRDKRWHLLELLNGALAGLAGITAGSGYVAPWAAVIIGIFAGSASFTSIWFLRRRMGLDDVLDVSSLQGTPGIVGTLLVGVFSTDKGLVYGFGFHQIGIQLLGIIVVLLWTSFWTFVVLSVIRMTVGTDVGLEAEELGLDVTQIGLFLVFSFCVVCCVLCVGVCWLIFLCVWLVVLGICVFVDVSEVWCKI
jgi:ammonium transporter, Amt family